MDYLQSFFTRGLKLIWVLAVCVIILNCSFIDIVGYFNPTSLLNCSTIRAGHPGESFDDFFKRFEGDPKFQKRRIQFPLKYITINDDDSNSIKYIQKTTWKYSRVFTTGGSKRIIRKKLINASTMEVRLQVHDTGFEMDFTFVKKNNLWWLSVVRDESD